MYTGGLVRFRRGEQTGLGLSTCTGLDSLKTSEGWTQTNQTAIQKQLDNVNDYIYCSKLDMQTHCINTRLIRYIQNKVCTVNYHSATKLHIIRLCTIMDMLYISEIHVHSAVSRLTCRERKKGEGGRISGREKDLSSYLLTRRTP